MTGQFAQMLKARQSGGDGEERNCWGEGVAQEVDDDEVQSLCCASERMPNKTHSASHAGQFFNALFLLILLNESICSDLDRYEIHAHHFQSN